jgi:tRNA(Ile)-lysidine synthase TilS/MesJ
MRNIIQNYNPKNNFWEENPQFQIVQPFKRFYKNDKSKGKRDSSELMWAIALIHYPKSDLYYIEDKDSVIARDLLGVKESEIESFWDKHKELIDFFVEMALTQSEKSLVSWEKRMRQRDRFLSEQVYTFGTVDEDGTEHKDNTKSFDDMQSKTAKFYEEYFKIKKELTEEESVSKNKREKSSTAKGEL